MPLIPVMVPDREMSVPRVAALIMLQRMRSPVRLIGAEELEHPIGLRRIEGEVAERQRHLDDPAVIDDLRLGGPGRVPLLGEVGVVLDQRIQLRAGRVHLEEIRIPPRVQWIEIDAHRVVGAEIAVAAPLRVADQMRFAIVIVDADIEIFVVVEDAQLGALGSGRPGVGIELIELVDDLGLRPDRIVQQAVDRRGLPRPRCGWLGLSGYSVEKSRAGGERFRGRERHGRGKQAAGRQRGSRQKTTQASSQPSAISQRHAPRPPTSARRTS